LFVYLAEYSTNSDIDLIPGFLIKMFVSMTPTKKNAPFFSNSRMKGFFYLIVLAAQFCYLLNASSKSFENHPRKAAEISLSEVVTADSSPSGKLFNC
jgi:hypothetical protein